MANPTTAGAIVSPASFATRVQLVRETIEARISKTPTTNPHEVRARLWVRWIINNVLESSQGQGV